MESQCDLRSLGRMLIRVVGLVSILVLLLLVSACVSSGKKVSSLSGASFAPAKSGFKSLRKFKVSEDADLLMGDSGIYEYTIQGLQKRPVLRKLYPKKTFKGVEADKRKRSLKSFNISRKPFTPVAKSICTSGTHRCGYLRNTRDFITQSSDGRELEIAQLHAAGIDENEEKLIGSAAYLSFKHSDLYTAVDNDDAQAESSIIATLDKRLEYEKLWKRFQLPRHKQLFIESLRAKSTVDSHIRVFELTGSIEDFKQAERIALLGNDQDKSRINDHSSKAITVFLGAKDRNSVNYMMTNYKNHIDYIALLDKYADESIRQHAIRHYRSVSTAPSLTNAFRLTQDTDDLVEAKRVCSSWATCREVEETLLKKLESLGLEIVMVDDKTTSTDYNKSTSEMGFALAQTRTQRKNVAIETLVKLNPEVLSIGILDAASLLVKAEIKLDNKYRYTDNIYGKKTYKTLVAKETVTVVLSPENNFTAKLSADFRVTEFEVVGSKFLDIITEKANALLGTNARADIVRELERVSSTVKIIDVTLK